MLKLPVARFLDPFQLALNETNELAQSVPTDIIVKSIGQKRELEHNKLAPF